MSVAPPNYTQIPNAVIALMPDMNDCELRVVLSICRATFGWHKTRDRISITQLEKATGLSRQGVVDGTAQAMKRGIVIRYESGYGFEYEIKVVNDSDYSAMTSQSNGLELVKPVDQKLPKLVNVVDTQKKVSKESKEKGAIAPRAPQSAPKHTDPLEHAFSRKEKVEAEGRWRTLLRGATRPGSERACEIAIAFAELTRIEPATQQQAKTALSAADQIVASGGTVDDMRAAWKVSQDPQKGFMVTDLHSLRGTVSALVAKQKRTGPQKPKRIGWTENDKGESVPVYEVAR
jgi:phage replication O-like protein O